MRYVGKENRFCFSGIFLEFDIVISFRFGGFGLLLGRARLGKSAFLCFNHGSIRSTKEFSNASTHGGNIMVAHLILRTFRKSSALAREIPTWVQSKWSTTTLRCVNEFG